jgi:hypothetical protein
MTIAMIMMTTTITRLVPHLASLSGSSVILTGLDSLSAGLHILHSRPVHHFRFVYSFSSHPPIAAYHWRGQQSNQHEAEGLWGDKPEP